MASNAPPPLRDATPPLQGATRQLRDAAATATQQHSDTHPGGRVTEGRGRRGLAYAAAAWAGSYAAVALGWTVLGRGFPFGSADPDAEMSALRALPSDVGAPAFALLFTVSAVGALLMSSNRSVPSAAGRRAMLVAGWLVAGFLLLVVPDTRVLARVGYAPMLILGLPFGWPEGFDYSTLVTWSVANQLWCMVGGSLLAATVLRWQRSTRELCVDCGRGERAAAWTGPESAARWGRRAAYVAAGVPVLYAIDRLAWLVGIPLLISSESLDELQESGAVWAGAGLGAFGLVGAVLTLGLFQRWGEVFPRWMVGLSGRRVPIALAVVPASLVAVLVTAGSLPVFVNFDQLDATGADRLAVLPMLLWPVWGVALGAATAAYYLRRRGACAGCGRG